MIVGAACGFGGAWLSGSIIIGSICGMIAGTLLSLIFAMMTLGLAVNQVATGLALTILGIGLSGLIGAGFVGERITPAPHLYIPGLTDIPLVGRILFGEDAFIYLSLALVVAVWWFLYRTRAGLILRACGDNHISAHALGYPVLRIRMLCRDVRRRVRGIGGSLSAARLYALLHSRHDRRPRLDRAGADRVRVLDAVAARDRRLSVRCRHDPAASRARRWASASPRNSCRRCLISQPSSCWCCCRARALAARPRRPRSAPCSCPTANSFSGRARWGATSWTTGSPRMFGDRR